MYINFDKNFDTLCFSGGGTKGLVFIGAVKALINKNIIYLDKINKYIGTSAGAILAFFLAIGYTPDELEEFVLNFDFKKLEPNVDCDSLFTKFGIDDGKKLEFLLTKLLNYKLGMNNITFLELFELTNKELIISTTCINNSKSKYFNYKFTPDEDVILAIKMSIAVPFYFYPVIYEGNHYVDGGILDNYPIQFGNKESTLGFTVVSDKYTQVDDFGNYMIKVIKLFLNANLITKVRHFKENTINIMCNEKNFIDFKMGYQAKQIMINKGYDRVRKYYQEFLKVFSNKVINEIIDKVDNISNQTTSESNYINSYDNLDDDNSLENEDNTLENDDNTLENENVYNSLESGDLNSLESDNLNSLESDNLGSLDSDDSNLLLKKNGIPELLSNNDTSEVDSNSSLTEDDLNKEKIHFNLS